MEVNKLSRKKKESLIWNEDASSSLPAVYRALIEGLIDKA